MHAESNGVAAHFSDAEWAALHEELGSLPAREMDARPTLSGLYRHCEYNPQRLLLKEARNKSWTDGYRDGRDEAVEPEDDGSIPDPHDVDIPDGYMLVEENWMDSLVNPLAREPESIRAGKGKKFVSPAAVLDWFDSIAHTMMTQKYMMDGDYDVLMTALEGARESYQATDLHQRHVTGNDIP